MNKTKISYGIYLFAPIFSPFRPFPEERGLSIIAGERKAWLKFRLIISDVRTCLFFLHLLPLSSGVAGRAMSAGSLPSGEGGGRGPPPFVFTSTMQRYYRIFWHLEIMISSYKFVQVRRRRPLIMSKKKVFPFISGTRCRDEHKTLPRAAQSAAVVNVTHWRRDIRIMRVRHAKQT